MARDGPPILFVSQAPPWPRDAGGNIRTWHVLAALAAEHPVTLVAAEPAAERRAEGLAALEGAGVRARFVPDTKSRSLPSLARSAGASLVRGLPLVVLHNRNAHLAAAVREEWEGGGHALLHLNHVDTVQYAPGGELARAVIDTHNLYFEYYGRLARREGSALARALHRREARLLARYELGAFARAAGVLVCSERERQILRELDPRVDAAVVPNGADCERFHPSERDPAENPPVVVFVGDMGYGPNDDGARFFVREVMPLLRPRVPGVRFAAVGKNPSPALLALAREHPDVEATGFVDDVREHVWRARACVVPLRYGAGTRLKVLEALALGVPTASTRLGAEGIDCVDGEDLLLADGAQELARALLRLFEDGELYQRMRRRARRTALERYDWRVVAARVREAYRSLTRSR